MISPSETLSVGQSVAACMAEIKPQPEILIKDFRGAYRAEI